jgi:glycosyltransferase involved in cell wall biosynthesis
LSAESAALRLGDRRPGIGDRFRLIARILSSYLALKYYLFGLRVRWRARWTRYDFCHAMDAMSLHAARGFAARGVPVLLDINEIPDPFERQGRHFVAADPAVKAHLARAFARDFAVARSVIAVSGAMTEFVRHRFGRDATAIHNSRAALSAPPSRAIRADLGAAAGTRIIVYPCTAAPHLGVEASIEMLRLLPDNFALVFVGRFTAPSYRERIERLIRRHRLEHRVLLKGELPEPDYLRYIAGADFGVVPLSFAYRNQRVVLPWRVIDLAAAGVPMVATASDELLRLKRDYDLGEIAASAEPADLAAALSRLAAATPERIVGIRSDLAAMAREFSPSRKAADYGAVLASLASHKTGRAAFVSNLALRANRRLIEFTDLACDAGWRIDLYAVKTPELALFKYPDRVRAIAISDRAFPRLPARFGIGAKWRMPDLLAGTWFGVKQLRRALRFARLVNEACTRETPWDAVIATDLFALPAGMRIGGPDTAMVYDATEIPDLRQRSAPFLRRIPAALRAPFRQWERRYARRAKLVLTTSHALARYLRRRYRAMPPADISAVRNAPELSRDEILARSPGRPLRDRLGLAESDCVIVSPCGISAESGALIALRMLRFLPADHVLVFIGRFATAGFQAEIEAAVARHQLSHRCFFLGEVDYPLYLRYLVDCDVGIILFDTAIANLRLAAPNRFFDLTAMGVPIVATQIEEVASFLKRTELGAVVRGRRPAVVARAVLELRERLGRDRRAGARQMRIARLYRWEAERANLIAALTERIGPLAGKRIALLTLRGAASNRRFLRIGRALHEAGAELSAFDTRIGGRVLDDRPDWLTTTAVD